MRKSRKTRPVSHHWLLSYVFLHAGIHSTSPLPSPGVPYMISLEISLVSLSTDKLPAAFCFRCLNCWGMMKRWGRVLALIQSAGYWSCFTFDSPRIPLKHPTSVLDLGFFQIRCTSLNNASLDVWHGYQRAIAECSWVRNQSPFQSYCQEMWC